MTLARFEVAGERDRGSHGRVVCLERRREDRLDRRPRLAVGDDARLRAQRRPRPAPVHATGSRPAGSRTPRSRRWRASSAGPSRVDDVRPRAADALAEVFGLELEELPADEGAGLWPQPVHAQLAAQLTRDIGRPVSASGSDGARRRPIDRRGLRSRRRARRRIRSGVRCASRPPVDRPRRVSTPTALASRARCADPRPCCVSTTLREPSRARRRHRLDDRAARQGRRRGHEDRRVDLAPRSVADFSRRRTSADVTRGSWPRIARGCVRRRHARTRRPRAARPREAYGRRSSGAREAPSQPSIVRTADDGRAFGPRSSARLVLLAGSRGRRAPPSTRLTVMERRCPLPSARAGRSG